MTTVCDSHGCQNPASVEPKLLVWAMGSQGKGEPAQIRTRLQLCGDCGHKFDAEDFISDAGWEQIRKTFAEAGYAHPDPETIKVLCEPLQ